MNNFRNQVEKLFESIARKIYRNKFKTLLIMLIFISCILSQLPKLSIDISTEGFLRKTDQGLIDYNAFRDQFGRDELIIAAIDSPDVFDKNFLAKLKAFHYDLKDNVPYLEDITSMINARNTRGEADRLIVEDLLENWPKTDREIAVIKKRIYENPLYKNLLISEDGRITTIVMKPHTYSSAEVDIDVLEGFEEDPTGREESEKRTYLTDEENSRIVSSVHKIAKKYEATDFHVYITGSASVTHFIKRSMLKDMRTFLSLAFITIILFLFIMFRKLSGVLLPLLIVALSLISTVALMAAFGVPLKMPTQILPSFLLAVGVGDSVHILAIFYHYYRKNPDRENAAAYSIGHSGLAIVMTSATTAGGLFAFATADVAPIADLGIFAGVGVMLAMLYTIVLLPALLAVWPVRSSKVKESKSENTPMDRMLTKVGMISTGHPIAILIISFVIIAISIFGITKIRFSHDPLRWLPENNSARVATEKIDKELRGTVNIAVVIDTGKENGLYDPGLLMRMDETASYLEKLEAGVIFIGKVWSITTILKETNRALHENRREFYNIPVDKKLIAQELLLFENSGSDDMEDFTDSQFSMASLLIKVPFKDAIAYSNFLDIITEHFHNNYPDEKTTITGMGSIFFKTLTNAITSMTKGYIYALIVITLLMILLIGRVRIGLLSMIPNLAPIIITLSIMGWFDIPMSLFTILVGNIAIGLAVDDTIHFMHNFRRYFEESGDAKFAVMETLHTTGRAMLVTSCVLSAGFYIFMFAQMNNIIHFGLLTGTAIIMALLADYFISPALMVLLNRNRKSV